MSDEQRPHPDDAVNPRGGGDQPDWRSAETGRFDPVRDDATRQMPTSGGPAGDATRQMPTSGGPAGDATRQMPASGAPAADQTRQIPPVDDEGAWAGRAQVRGPQPVTESTTIGGYAPVAEPEPQRKWWLPILLGVLALVVVAALIWAGWLITRSSGTDTPAPAASSAPVPTSAAPTSVSPSPSPSRSPSPPPTEEPPAANIPVPPLVGLNQGDAVRILDDLGLGYRVSFTAGEGPLGTVVSSNPKEGAQVKPGTEVRLVVVDRLVSPSPSPSVSDQLPAE